MATKLKRWRPRKQFFSELDAIIEEAEAITLDQKKREKTKVCCGEKQLFSKLDDGAKEKKREKTKVCCGEKQFFSELNDDAKEKKREALSSEEVLCTCSGQLVSSLLPIVEQ